MREGDEEFIGPWVTTKSSLYVWITTPSLWITTQHPWIMAQHQQITAKPTAHPPTPMYHPPQPMDHSPKHNGSPPHPQISSITTEAHGSVSKPTKPMDQSRLSCAIFVFRNRGGVPAGQPDGVQVKTHTATSGGSITWYRHLHLG